MSARDAKTSIGVQVRVTDQSPDLRWIAKQVESAGIESLFLPEHTHVPLNQSLRHPGGDDLMMPAARGLDTGAAMAIATAVTTTLRVGSGVLLLPQHDPIVLAKSISTIDHAGGGRLLLGIGAGWNTEEMQNHGVDPNARWAIVREKILSMSEIWSNDVAEFHGQYVHFGPLEQWPKPVQRPRPPTLLAGEGPRAIERVLEYGDGWFPNDHDELLGRAVELRRRWDKRARSHPVTISAYSMPWDRGHLEDYVGAGIDRLVFNIGSSSEMELLNDLERVRLLAGDFLH